MKYLSCVKAGFMSLSCESTHVTYETSKRDGYVSYIWRCRAASRMARYSLFFFDGDTLISYNLFLFYYGDTLISTRQYSLYHNVKKTVDACILPKSQLHSTA